MSLDREPGLQEGRPTVVRSCPGEQLVAHRQTWLLVGKFDERATFDNFDRESRQTQIRSDLRASVGLVSPEMQGTGKHPIAHPTPGERRVLMEASIGESPHVRADPNYDSAALTDRHASGV